jgi:hypothetical protein
VLTQERFLRSCNRRSCARRSARGCVHLVVLPLPSTGRKIASMNTVLCGIAAAAAAAAHAAYRASVTCQVDGVTHSNHAHSC